MRRCGEVLIASAPAPAARNHQALIGTGEIVNALASVGIVENRPDRYFQNDVVALLPGSVGTFAVTSSLCLVLRIEPEVHEGIVALARLHDHIPTMSAIAARRATARDKLLPTERHAAIPAVSGLHANFRFIDEHQLLAARLSSPKVEC